MLKVINQVKDASESFLMDDLRGVDLMVDAVNDSLKKMNKYKLNELYLKALKNEFYEGENHNETTK